MREAEKLCTARGMRLPRIRELALFAISKGAKGLAETDTVRDQDLLDGYRLIDVLGAEGKSEKFYYNGSGFSDPALSRPQGEASTEGTGEHPQYWSSSECVGHADEADPELHSYYVLDRDGRIHDHYRTVRSLVLCVP
jgi:hypothetical protein